MSHECFPNDQANSVSFPRCAHRRWRHGDTLRKDFIDTSHDKAVVKANITPAFLSRIKSATSGSDDGDVHMAAVPDATIGLPMVAEITNAKLHRPTVATIKTAAANHQSMAVEGVWRIWCEHGVDSEFEQGQPVDAPTDSNPAHVFEDSPADQGRDHVDDGYLQADRRLRIQGCAGRV